MDRVFKDRTRVVVKREVNALVEAIEGGMSAWRFRPHFHMGDEIVEITKGAALLHLETRSILVREGQSITVPARTMHRFEAVDAAGWAFRSTFTQASSGEQELEEGELKTRVIQLMMTRQSLQTRRADIAQRCSMSAGHLSRRFRKETGSSLHNYHVVLSLQQAKSLLRDNTALADTAVACGFYDQAHLSREFVRTFGMTPGAFRSAWSNAGARVSPM